VESAKAILGDAQVVITGATVSVPVIVMVNEHSVPTSVEQVTVVVPTGKTEPDGGLQTGGGVGIGGIALGSPPQLPDVVGVVYVTTFVHPPVSLG
jgi:hypothetical protein